MAVHALTRYALTPQFMANIQPQPSEKARALVFGAFDPSRSESAQKAHKVGLIILAALFCTVTLGFGAFLVKRIAHVYSEYNQEVNAKVNKAVRDVQKYAEKILPLFQKHHRLYAVEGEAFEEFINGFHVTNQQGLRDFLTSTPEGQKIWKHLFAAVVIRKENFNDTCVALKARYPDAMKQFQSYDRANPATEAEAAPLDRETALQMAAAYRALGMHDVAVQILENAGLPIS